MDHGLIGEHLSHSYSKEIHELIGKYEYCIKEIEQSELESFLKNRCFKAINVTIPYKEKVMPYLDYISDTAKMIGSVNTIVNKDGILYGYNTDFFGMKNQLRHMGVSFKNKKVLILGTGGTSKTAYAVAKTEEASEILTVSRKESDKTVTYEQAVKYHNDAGFIFNTTPVGMFPNADNKPIDITPFNSLSGVFDAIYNPLRTLFIQDSAKKNIPASGGLYMLVSQAVYASSLFCDTEFDNSLTDKIYREILKEKQDIALIGMPSCGKTTVGKILSEKTGKEFFDTDEEIASKTGMTIPEIFEKYGEEAFRKIESETIFELSKKGNRIISTGGGAVLNNQNIINLKKNCKVVFLDRALDNLIATSDRPLSANRNDLRKLYCKRIDLYRQSADIIADGNKKADEVAENIIREVTE